MAVVAVRVRSTAVAVVLLGAVLALASCGTRLPDSAFPSASPHPTATSPTPTGSGSTDVGVTAGSITVGNIVSRTNPFDPRAFVGPYYGVKSFVDDLNARGGINGRKITLVTCDDGGSSIGNVDCVRKLVTHDRVFALVGNGILDYAGAEQVNNAGVPDVGSQPIDSAYTRYHHLWDIYGESYPRNGTIGYGGKLSGGTEVYRYFKVANPAVPRTAGVVYFNQAASQKYGLSIAAGLRREGYTVVTAQVNFALPDFDSAVITMAHAGVRYVFDALDRVGNERLCAAMDAQNFSVVAKVTTTQSWDAAVGADYKASPTCRNTIYATGNTRSYEDTRYAQVARFRAAMAREGWDTPTAMSEWALEAWAGALWFSDAAASCGEDLTRTCVETYLSRPAEYDGHGLLTPRNFVVRPHTTTSHNCINVARWQDSAGGGHGGWVTQVPDMDTNCFDVYSVLYSP